MFEKLNHRLQKFSYTRLDDSEFLLRPIFLNMSEKVAFKFLENHLRTTSLNAKYDEDHHEIFVKENECETSYLFTTDENNHAIISISTYAKKRNISYKKLLDTIEALKKVFSSYLIDEKLI